MNFLNGMAANGFMTCGAFSRPLSHQGPVLLGFRGEDVTLVQPSDGLIFEVKVVEPMGSHLLLTGLVNEERVRVVASPQAQINPGMIVGLKLETSKLVVMDKQTGKAL